MNDISEVTFSSFGFSDKILKALEKLGYETPSPIQAKAIPPMLEGRDLLGQAQTGTGKTAAFALPILQNIVPDQRNPQVLVLAPTRELAIQVAEAFQSYAKFLPEFHTLPIYGGQGYETQIRALKRGVHVVVGTPGRVMDHIRKGTLKMDGIKHLVLDEADEMLRMGFIDDVEWILEQTQQDKQIALFSATMPPQIAKVASRYLQEPVKVKIEVATTTAETIKQRYWSVAGLSKLDALTRILEVEPTDGMIIFVRTKNATIELAEKLEARGFSCAALNGDISQHLREKTVERLKSGKIDILIATDVAARGLDVERISHVINYDIPYDTESYVHRIGRTGRAGRAGEAILFVERREQRMLRSIEYATRQRIEQLTLPSVAKVNKQRVEKFKERVVQTLNNVESEWLDIVNEITTEHGFEPVQIAAALAKMTQGNKSLFLAEEEVVRPRYDSEDGRGKRVDQRQSNSARDDRRNSGVRGRTESAGYVDYKLGVGARDGLNPRSLVNALSRLGNCTPRVIGNVQVREKYSIVALPSNVARGLKGQAIDGNPINIKKMVNDS